ncbi:MULTISPECIES: hypothetical protein [Burkholderia]|uniref:Uncharacterized protein n=1 Tax=Burkholderia paludis TaxID=1506587 RepID=A0A6P2KEV8_9BURK|nr:MULTISPECIES: hypothetical protein [Burkholderia]VWB53006.1 hypothetical protein BPA30113_02299 [Burkholderia paludis]
MASRLRIMFVGAAIRLLQVDSSYRKPGFPEQCRASAPACLVLERLAGLIPIISTRDSLPDWLQNSAAGQSNFPDGAQVQVNVVAS